MGIASLMKVVRLHPLIYEFGGFDVLQQQPELHVAAGATVRSLVLCAVWVRYSGCDSWIVG